MQGFDDALEGIQIELDFFFEILNEANHKQFFYIKGQRNGLMDSTNNKSPHYTYYRYLAKIWVHNKSHMTEQTSKELRTLPHIQSIIGANQVRKDNNEIGKEGPLLETLTSLRDACKSVFEREKRNHAGYVPILVFIKSIHTYKHIFPQEKHKDIEKLYTHYMACQGKKTIEILLYEQNEVEKNLVRQITKIISST